MEWFGCAMGLSSQQRWELALVVALSTLVAAAAVVGGRFDLVSGLRADVKYDKTYGQGQVLAGQSEAIQGEWTVTPKGLVLCGRCTGTVTVAIPADRDGQLRAMLYGRPGSSVSAVLSASGDGRSFRKIAGPVSFDGERIDLTSAVSPGPTIWIRFSASGQRDEPLLLSRLRLVEVKSFFVFPNLAIAALLILTPVLAYLVRWLNRPAGALLFSLTVLCSQVVLAEGFVWLTTARPTPQWWERVLAGQDRDAYFLIPYAVLLGFLGWSARAGPASRAAESLWPPFALAGILVACGSDRLATLSKVAWVPLDPDANYYRYLAETMRALYDTGAREPFWIWMIKGWFWVTGDSALNLRLLTVLLSLLVVVMVYKFFRDYTGSSVCGIVVAALVAWNPYLDQLSTRGLREEAYTLAVLGVVHCVFVSVERLSIRRRAVGMALAGAAAQLLRFNSYLFLVPLISLWAWRNRQSWRVAALVLAFVAAVSVPHLAYSAHEFGDPFYSLNHVAVWNRNYEFVAFKKTGCRGCPTAEEFASNSFAGAPVGSFDYMVGLHSARELAGRTFDGLLDMYVRRTDLFEVQTGIRSRSGHLLYLIGFALLLLSPYRELLAVVALAINVIPFFMTLGFEPRLGVHTVPFATFVLAYALWWPFDRVVRFCKEAGPSRPLHLPGPLRPSRDEGGAYLQGRS
ncbi:MAG: glycosyltransferase family 39 protein [Nitrospirota bacterium]